MPTIDEVSGINPSYEKTNDTPMEQTPFDVPQQSNRMKELLMSETGEGSIEDYIDHPMNFNNSKGVARVLRGLTGMIGNLNYAIVDIIIGSLDVLKTSSKGVNKNVNNNGVTGVS